MPREERPPHRRSSWIFLALALGLPLAAASAQAQPRRDGGRPHADLLFALGVGGEVEVEATDVDLEPGFGLYGGVSYPLHRYFSLGGRLGFMSWQSEPGDDANADRNSLIDLVIVPAGTFRAADSVELHVALPLGPSFDFYGEDEVLGGAVDINPALGFTLGFLVGARFWLGNDIGLITELGFVLHGYEHEVDVQPGNLLGLALPGASAQVDVDLAQPHLHIGLFFDM